MHVSGTIQLDAGTPLISTCPQPNGEPMAGSDHYQAVAARGLPYGSAFQGVQRCWLLDEGVLGELLLPETAAAAAHTHLVPPALLDAAVQLLLTALADGVETYVPVRVQQVWGRGPFNPEAHYRAFATPRLDGQTLRGDLFLFANDEPVFAAYDLCLEPLAGTAVDVADWMYTVAWQAQPLKAAAATPDVQGDWLILGNPAGIGTALAGRLQAAGAACTFVLPPRTRADFDRLLQDRVAQRPLQAIVYLPDAAADPTSDTDAIAIMHLVQALSAINVENGPRLWLVTQDAVPAANADLTGLAASALWGLGRVLDHEHPELACKRVDVTAVSLDALWAELWADDGEREVALRANGRFVSRLLPYTAPSITPAAAAHQPGQPYRVATTRPGILDNLGQQPWRRVLPGAGEVEIEVRATGLNFMNVMAALGVLPGYENGVGPLGIECAGVVTAVAPDVTQFQVGDAVMGIAFNSLGSHAVTNAHLLALKPETLSFAEAATIPIVFLTAYYALHLLGHMAAGERVLIHAGAGGVGLAAIQLAQRAGAEIFATAGSPEKRAYLRDLGVPHIMDSRSLAFAADVMQLTNGEGVDLLLNSLAGEAVLKGLEILRPYGRFLEIGKRDIYGNSRIGLLPFQKNLSYFAIDLDRMSRERPQMVGAMLREVMQMLAAGEIRPLPQHTFPVAQVSDAFHFMAQARHIGKIVVVQEEMKREEGEEGGVKGEERGGTYLITGGLGALGLLTARWLAQQGPCDLVLLGRSAPDEKAQTAVAELQQLGARVVPMQADVTQLADLQRVFTAIESDLAPLRGIVHAAGVLADSTLLQMDAAQFRRAFAPKVAGAWHLHTLSKEHSLDFFILFSSVTALLGTPGQGNYAAGNAFLDALAQHRHAQGLPALSINWGPWAQVGLAAAQANRGNRLALRGVGSITPEQGVDALVRLHTAAVTQAAVMPFDLGQWQAFYPAARAARLFAELAGAREEGTATAVTPSATATFHDELLAAAPGRARHNLFANHLREQVAQVLRMAPGRVPLNKPLKTLGLDSLMTLELRTRLENSLGLTLSATFIWNYPTIEALLPFLAQKMGVPLADGGEETAVSPVTPTPPTSTEPAAALDDLSQEDIEAMLADELSEIDDLLKDL
ncbi:MAG: SDR family NAD(P)-dependent oxidoreductase [Chloroflexota bacterium]